MPSASKVGTLNMTGRTMNREEALGLLNTKLDEYRKMFYAEFAAPRGVN